MTQWSPIWKIQINSVEYTDITLSNLTIVSGRTNIYEQAQAGYANVTLMNWDQAIIPIQINDSLSIQLKDTSGTFVPIFGGSVVDFGIEIAEAGSVMYTQTFTITALGALSRLPKALTDGVLAQDFDGNQIATILREVLFSQWQQVPPALTWAAYDPAITWATAENSGYGTIDTPGNYELAARTSDRTDIYSLVSALATSGLGYLYEDAQGLISYADSTHRTTYLSTNGYTELSANEALARGIKIQTRVGDVRNDITLKYGANSSSEVSANDVASIALYGDLAQIISTTVKHSADATDQADFYLTLRANPEPNFNSITYALTNPELSNGDRDALINIFMGLPVSIIDLPLNMNSGAYQGFVEGWSFSASYNELSISFLASPLAYSLAAMRWNDVPVVEKWNTVSNILTWENATIVA